jgi:hypothetical protein
LFTTSFSPIGLPNRFFTRIVGVQAAIHRNKDGVVDSYGTRAEVIGVLPRVP